MKISVTAEDIARGERSQCDACPVALAVDRATDGAAVVGRQFISVVMHGHAHLLDSPPEVVAFVDRFDDGLPVVPFEFELPDPPADGQRLMTRAGGTGP